MQVDLKKIKAHYEALKSERQSSWDPHWKDIAEHFLPRGHKFLCTTGGRNTGYKRNQRILDDTGTKAARTSAAGFISHLASPSKPWFRLQPPNPKDLENFGARQWLDDSVSRMLKVLGGSNAYTVLGHAFLDLLLFGTACPIYEEDDEDVLRLYHAPIGSYVLANDSRGRPQIFAHEYARTARQLMDTYPDTVPELVRTAAKNSPEQWFDCIQYISPNKQHDAQNPLSKRYVSVRYVSTCKDDDPPLKVSGFDSFPVLATRWTTYGEDVYGTSPGMDALPLVRRLQKIQEKTLKAIDKMVDPAMLVSPGMDGRNNDFNTPGSQIATADPAAEGAKPAHVPNLPIHHAQALIEDLRKQVFDTLYANLFLMFATDDRSNVTAQEIRARLEEKYLSLAPVVERFDAELLRPLIDRLFVSMAQRGMFEKPPASLAGKNLTIRYLSVLSTAQQATGLGSMDRLLMMVQAVAPMKPDVLDKIDFDQMIDEVADATSLPPRIIRSDDDVAGIREARQQMEQQMAQATAANENAKAAASLSRVDMNQNTAAKQLIEDGSEE